MLITMLLDEDADESTLTALFQVGAHVMRIQQRPSQGRQLDEVKEAAQEQVGCKAGPVKMLVPGQKQELLHIPAHFLPLLQGCLLLYCPRNGAAPLARTAIPPNPQHP